MRKDPFHYRVDRGDSFNRKSRIQIPRREMSDLSRLKVTRLVKMNGETFMIGRNPYSRIMTKHMGTTGRFLIIRIHILARGPSCGEITVIQGLMV